MARGCAGEKPPLSRQAAACLPQGTKGSSCLGPSTTALRGLAEEMKVIQPVPVSRPFPRECLTVMLLQGVTCEVKMVASNVLVTLARSHFHFVMAELQSQLKAMGKVPDEIVLLTLGKMAHSYGTSPSASWFG